VYFWHAVPMLKRFRKFTFGSKPAEEIPAYLKTEIRLIAQEAMSGDVASGIAAIQSGNRILEFVESQPAAVRERIWNYIARIREEAGQFSERQRVKT